MGKIYAPFERNQSPIMFTDLKSAELIKYASNSFLAMKISFINQVAGFCENVGADVKQVAKGMGYDNRIGSRFLQAGIGYGGSCFPKDVQALIYVGKEKKLGLKSKNISLNFSYLCLVLFQHLLLGVILSNLHNR